MQSIIEDDNLTIPCKPWLTDADNSDRMQPIPSTWTLAPVSMRNRGIHGIYCCHCGNCCLIPYTMGESDNGARIIKRFQCVKCKHFAHLRLQDWDKRKLFCIAYETFIDKDRERIAVLNKEYTHAETREQAMYFFEQSHLDIEYRLIDVGRVIGYFGTEKDEKHLTV